MTIWVLPFPNSRQMHRVKSNVMLQPSPQLQQLQGVRCIHARGRILQAANDKLLKARQTHMCCEQVESNAAWQVSRQGQHDGHSATDCTAEGQQEVSAGTACAGTRGKPRQA